MSKAIQLISIDENGKCALNPEAEEFLSKIDKNIAVICVAGLYRTGKSYLLNRILKRQSGFEIGSTIKSCTKGIWIWNETLSLKNMEVLVIDTEGLGSAFEDRNESIDMVIFCLAVLLSSFFIYNSLKNIDEAALESLSLVVNFSKKLQAEFNEVENYVNDFPYFLWVIRDFALNLINLEGKTITPKQYLEESLTMMEEKDNAEKKNNHDLDDLNLEKKNETRRLIKMFFKERDCKTVIRPVKEDKKLRMIDQIPEDELRPEFLTQMNELITYIFKGLKPKMVQGSHINGEMLINLIKMYIKALNSNCLPDVKSSLKIVVDSQIEVINTKAFNKFLDNMLDIDYKSISNLSELLKHGQVFRNDSLVELKQITNFNIPNSMFLRCYNNLNAKMNDQMEDLVIKWRDLSTKQCNTIYDNITREFSENNDENVDVLTLLDVMGEVQLFLEDSVSNSLKYEVIYPKVMTYFTEQLKKTYTDQKNKYEIEINGLKAEKDSLQNIIQQTKKQMEKNKDDYENEINKTKEEMQNLRLNLEERIDEKNKLIKSIQLSNETTIEDLKVNIGSLQEQIEQKNKDFMFQTKLSKVKGSVGGGNIGGNSYSDSIVEGIMTRLDLFKDNLLKSEIEKARMTMKQEISYRIEDMQEEFQKKISSLRKEMEKIVLKVKAASKRELEEFKQIIKVSFIL